MSKIEKGAQSQIEEFLHGQQREQFLEKYIYCDADIIDTVIRRYLRRLSGAKCVPTLSGGTGLSALSPVKKPKTLEDAKLLADIILTK